MLTEIVSYVAVGAILLASWLLPKYLERRVTAAAEGAVQERVGRVLADQRHELDKQLEVHRGALGRDLEQFRQTLGLQAERYSQDYALFAARRNQVYAETYALLEKARGLFSPHFSMIVMGPDYSRSGPLDLKRFAASNEHIGDDEKEQLLRLVDQDLNRARELAKELHEKVGLRAAHIGFRDYKNACVLESLYFSNEVEVVVDDSITKVAALAARSTDLEHLQRIDYDERARLLGEVDAVVTNLRRVMRTEMQAGFLGAGLVKEGEKPPKPDKPSVGTA